MPVRRSTSRKDRPRLRRASRRTEASVDLLSARPGIRSIVASGMDGSNPRASVGRER
jgi:hypothetical protein